MGNIYWLFSFYKPNLTCFYIFDVLASSFDDVAVNFNPYYDIISKICHREFR